MAGRLKPWMGWGLLVTAIILTELAKSRPAWVENWYSQGIYPPVSRALRLLFGWIPFSIGDLLIGGLLIWLGIQLLQLIRSLRQRKVRRFSWKLPLRRMVVAAIFCYLLFNWLWGLNYYRLGSAYLLDLDPTAYTTQEVDSLTAVLNQRLWKLQDDSAAIDQRKTRNRDSLCSMAEAAYTKAAEAYPFLAFRHRSFKPHLIGPLQTYTGYAGYLMPFTGEAHADLRAPAFTLPFTVSHEMAHQVGFGTESEANMAAYLAGRSSPEPLLRYSAYSAMMSYALRELYLRDSVRYVERRDNLPPLVIRDRKEQEEHYLKYRNPAQPVINWIYHRYLLLSNQPLGLDSYSYVVAWLVAYARRYGWEAI